jgi:hypothetical protein
MGATTSSSCSEAVSPVAFRPLSLPKLLPCDIRLVDMLADKRHHVGRTVDAGQARIEDELGYPCGVS